MTENDIDYNLPYSQHELFCPCVIDDSISSSSLRESKKRASLFFKVITVFSSFFLVKLILNLLSSDFLLIKESNFEYFTLILLLPVVFNILHIYLQSNITFQGLQHRFVNELLFSVISLVTLEIYSFAVYSKELFYNVVNLFLLSSKKDFIEVPIELIVFALTIIFFIVYLIILKVKSKLNN